MDSANKSLTDSGPIDPDGKPKSDAKDEAIAAHLAGVPDTLPPQWCANCEAEVKPKGKGKCPRCGRILANSFLARKHPVNKLHRQRILDELIADYRPQTRMLRDTCDDLAGVREQLETKKPGSPEHSRLLEQSSRLYATLETARAANPSPPPDNTLPDLSDLTPDQMLDVARQTYVGLLEMYTTVPEQPIPAEAHSPVPADISGPGPSQPAEEPATEPAPEATCVWCRLVVSRCQAIRESRLEDWRLLHYDDPVEKDRRIREQRENDYDEMIFATTGWPTARQVARAEAREPKDNAEQAEQRRIRQQLGWELPGSTRRI